MLYTQFIREEEFIIIAIDAVSIVVVGVLFLCIPHSQKPNNINAIRNGI